ncbi:MAG TPA: hypothetical protein DCS88_13930 [Alphaproteobacteria bacterium]|nr:hypothetical protein [Alphaproteobacteria bacterium]
MVARLLFSQGGGSQVLCIPCPLKRSNAGTIMIKSFNMVKKLNDGAQLYLPIRRGGGLVVCARTGA